MELLIRTVGKHPIISPLAESSSQRGDVIAACPDGWEWSQAERENPEWIIICVGITEVEAGALLEAARPGEGVLRRRIGVDTTGLAAGDVLTREQLTARVF